MIKIKVELTFTTPVLGMASGDPDIHAKYVASKSKNAAKQAQEVALVPPRTPEEIANDIRQASTVFLRDQTGLLALDYQIRGMFKEGIKALIHQRHAVMDSALFVKDRLNYFHQPDGPIWSKAPVDNQRPLRGQTPQGERIALANSEELPVGSTLPFEIRVIPWYIKSKSTKPAINEGIIEAVLRYGEDKGFGQWRSGGWGRFSHTIQVVENTMPAAKPAKAA